MKKGSNQPDILQKANEAGKKIDASEMEQLAYEAGIRGKVADHFSELNKVALRMVVDLIGDNLYKFPIVTSLGIEEFSIDGTKIAWHYEAYAAMINMNEDQLRTLLEELCFASCIDRKTCGKRIRVKLRFGRGNVALQIRTCGDSNEQDMGGDEAWDVEGFKEADKGDEAISKTSRQYRYTGDPTLPLQVAKKAFEKMNAPQLRRVMHTICGGIYKLRFPTERRLDNEDGEDFSEYTPKILCINGTKVSMMYEVETCEVMEKMPACELRFYIEKLCCASSIFLTNQQKRFAIDGSKISLQVRLWRSSDGYALKEQV